jgi:hypothetical protein
MLAAVDSIPSKIVNRRNTFHLIHRDHPLQPGTDPDCALETRTELNRTRHPTLSGSEAKEVFDPPTIPRTTRAEA